jgi:alkaline phosphatase D
VSSPLSRRRFLTLGSAALLATGARPLGAQQSFSQPQFSPPPFALGIASGDPTHDSVVLWTRLAPDPLAGSGMPPFPVRVRWELASDPGLQRVVRRGSRWALPQAAHSVHALVRGLEPDRWYWYRFRTGRHASAIGRTRTLPAPWSEPRQLRFGFVSCQDYQAGYYPAYAHLAEEPLDFVLHLGDYIYETPAMPGGPRLHQGGEPFTLAEYRSRHAQYRSDPQLQAAHASFPFIATWDDHEVEDNYAGVIAADNDVPGAPPVPPQRFRQRRANAYRAYLEHLPLRAARAGGPVRGVRFGQLADLCVLDTRRWRSNQPCGGLRDSVPPPGDDLARACGEELDPAATMTGPRQEAWLLQRLAASPARWNALAQQVMMARFDFDPAASTPLFNMDAWDGYASARLRLLGGAAERGVRNLVVLSGDTHSSWVADLRADFSDPASPVVASEFVGPAISSQFPPALVPAVLAAMAHPRNAHVKFFDGIFRGYARCEVTPERWRCDYRAVNSVLAPAATVHTLASFEVQAGAPGANPV